MLKPIGTYSYRIEAAVSGTISLKTVEMRKDSLWAEGSFLNYVRPKIDYVNGRGNTEDAEKIDNTWTVESSPTGPTITSSQPDSGPFRNCPLSIGENEKVDATGRKRDLLGPYLRLYSAPHLANRVNDARELGGKSATSAECDITVTVKASVKIAPALDAGFELANYVGEDGKCEFAFRDAYLNRYSKNQDGNGLWFSGNAENGAHSYLAIHSLGKSKMTPAEVMGICRGRIGMIFPGGAVDTASPKTGAVVINEHKYKLMGPFFETLLVLASQAGIIGKTVVATLRASEVVPPIVQCVESSPLHFYVSGGSSSPPRGDRLARRVQRLDGRTLDVPAGARNGQRVGTETGLLRRPQFGNVERDGEQSAPRHRQLIACGQAPSFTCAVMSRRIPQMA